jgi:hypothetical protein
LNPYSNPRHGEPVARVFVCLILAGLGWYFALRNYCGNYYSATFIIKAVMMVERFWG